MQTGSGSAGASWGASAGPGTFSTSASVEGEEELMSQGGNQELVTRVHMVTWVHMVMVRYIYSKS